MKVQVLVDGAYIDAMQNVDVNTSREVIKQMCVESFGVGDFQLIYTDAEVQKMRSGAYQSELDGQLFDLLLDDVLPAFNAQLPEATQAKVLDLLNQRAAIKAQYPKPAA